MMPSLVKEDDEDEINKDGMTPSRFTALSKRWESLDRKRLKQPYEANAIKLLTELSQGLLLALATPQLTLVRFFSTRLFITQNWEYWMEWKVLTGMVTYKGYFILWLKIMSETKAYLEYMESVKQLLSA